MTRGGHGRGQPCWAARFEGTSAELLKQLNDFMRGKPRPDGAGRTRRRGMGGALRRIAPALRKLGYEVEFKRAGEPGTRIVSITTPEQKSRCNL